MTPDNLFLMFDRISEAPEASGRIRQFILDSAARGRFSSGTVHAGAVAELWGAPTASQSLQLPVGWRWGRLGDLCTLITDGEHATPPRITEHQVPLVTAKNVRDGYMDFTNTDWVSLSTAAKAWKRCKPQFGDLLMVCVGATTGRVCVLRKDVDMVLVRSVALMRPGDLISSDYLAMMLRSSACQLQIWNNVKVAAQPCLYLNRISSLLVPVAPVEKQSALVAQVEQLSALCDQFQTALNKRELCRDKLVAASLHSLTNEDSGEDGAAHSFKDAARFYINHLPRLTIRQQQVQALRDRALDLAVKGRLVQQQDSDGNSTELLAALREHQSREAKQHKYLPLPEAIPFEIPGSWTWVPLQNILAGDTQNGFSKRPDDSPNGTPILRISAGTVRRDGVVAEEEFKRISGIGPEIHAKFSLRAGDLLACRFNGNRQFVGRMSLYQSYSGIDPIYPDKLIRVRLYGDLTLPSLISCFFNSPMMRMVIEKYCETTVGNWGISATDLKRIPIPLPPVGEQVRIAAKLDQLTSLCDELDANLKRNTKERTSLLESTLLQALAANGVETYAD